MKSAILLSETERREQRWWAAMLQKEEGHFEAALLTLIDIGAHEELPRVEAILWARRAAAAIPGKVASIWGQEKGR